MDRSTVNIRLTTLIFAVFGLALFRLMPHPPNFTPIVAVALFGGAHFDRRALAFIVPLAAMLFSDVLLELFFPGAGFHDLMWVVYGAFAVIVAMGFVVRRWESPFGVPVMAMAASLWFFVMTNFAVWLSSGLYPKTWEGLVACYIAALPFFGHAVAGDLFYAGLLFGGWHLARRNFPVLAR